MKKVLIVFLAIFAFTAILIGFNSKPFEKEKPKVVVVLKGEDSQYWQILKAGVEKGIRDFGVDGQVFKLDIPEEESQDIVLRKILKQNPDVLIFSPINKLTNIPLLNEFVKNNISVLLLDSDVSWENETSYIGSDNKDLGEKGGALLASQLQPGNKVALIAGELIEPYSSERIKGAKLSLEAAGIQIATEKVNLPNETEPIKEVMDTILQDHPDINGVFTVTDIMALGAFEVIEEYGLSMPVIGADGVNEMIELIEEGKLPGTVAQNPYDMGYLSVLAASRVAKGEKVEKNIDSGIDIIIKGNAKERLDFQKKLLR